ncbi:hypothetical protein PLESTB_001615200 [Pleodorina starrii]|uniref:Uncharacterized protein n=1 Tax=Pleodorina starrii TaxID=330485 RepID=A0A9W6F8P0_9CHLO|nr:hypothetical protein PLESTB_001615200 [Pleodorina starrii]
MRVVNIKNSEAIYEAGIDGRMRVHSPSEDGGGRSPPSSEPYNSDAAAKTRANKLASREELRRTSGAGASTTAHVDSVAKLVDIAFLVDCTDRLRSVLDTLRDILRITGELVREKHPGVGIHVAFIGSRSHDHSIVAELKPLGNETFEELTSIRLRASSSTYGSQDMLPGVDFEEVLGLRWSAATRVLVQVSDAPTAAASERKAGGSGTGEGSCSAGHGALLQRLHKECGLQAHYVLTFDDTTRKFAGEILKYYNEPGWLFLKRLDEPGTLPYKFAEQIVGLVDEAAAAEVALADTIADDVTGPVTPENTPDLPAVPTEGEQSTVRSTSQASQFMEDHKVTLPQDVDGVSPNNRYHRASSEDGTGPSAQDASPRSAEAGAGQQQQQRQQQVPPTFGRPSDKGDGRSSPRSSPLAVASTAQTTPKGSLRAQSGSGHGSHHKSTRPSSVAGADTTTPQTDPRPTAASGHSSSPSEAADGASPKGSLRTEAGALDAGPGPEAGTGTVDPRAAPHAEAGSAHSGSSSRGGSPPSVAGAGETIPKSGPTAPGAGVEERISAKSGPPSSAGSGRNTPRSVPRSEAGASSAAPRAAGPRSEAYSVSSLGAPPSTLRSSPPSEAGSGSPRSSATTTSSRPLLGSTRLSGAPGPKTSATEAGASAGVQPLPWSARALADFKAEMRKTGFVLLDPSDEPLAARLDAVFALPQELWPVLPPGAVYCLEAADPRLGSFAYLQHRDFPHTKVRLGTYFGKWGRHLVDYVVSWQPTPRAEAAWQLAGDGKQPPLPWEPRQVVAHTTQGEYQYGNTRMKFKGPKSTQLGAEVVEWSDAHGVDLVDTKAANETAPRNSDKDRDAHLLYPPRPNTWGEMARRPLVGNLRSRGGGAYVHHINYDNSGLRASCGRRIPTGFFFTLVPNVQTQPPTVPGGPVSSNRPSSAGRAIAAARQSRSKYLPPKNVSATSAAAAASAAVAAVAAAVTKLQTPRTASNLGPAGYGSQAAGRKAAAGAVVGSNCSGGGGGGGCRLPVQMSLAEVDVVSLTAKEHWRTYDVPFNHPIHSARAQDLGAEEARASGRNVRSFSDAAAVSKVAEQELRLPRPFVPGPLVLPSWDDVPRLYAEHMGAARQLMPVTELDNYGSSKLHMLIHHLQCAATLEYDRLDAKLLLLPQMARLGCKSVEVDAWLQALIEHASYLYDKLEIADTELWDRAPAPGQHQRGSARAVLRSSVAAAPPEAALAAAAAATATAPGASQGWVFPDPLRGTVHESRSAVNLAAQTRPALREAAVPAHQLTKVEWSAIAAVMDPTRHSTLVEAWLRMRPLMTGLAAAPAADSEASSYISSNARATVSGGGDVKAPLSVLTTAADPYTHGSVNRDVLDYVDQDLAAMSCRDSVPGPPPPAKLPKHRGYRGEGPLPPELVADMPRVHKPVRCRGAAETPLPPEFEKMDIWNMRTKAEQATPRGIRVSPAADPDPLDAGAVRSSQAAVHRLQAARQFAATHQAAVRKSMQLAKGEKQFDEPDAPHYGSDVAEDDFSTDITSESGSKAASTPRRRPHAAQRPGGSGSDRRAGTATQTTEDLGHPTAEERALAEERSRAATEAAEIRQSLLKGNGRSRQEILEEALRSAEAAIRSLQPRPPGSSLAGWTPPPDGPDSPRLLAVREEPRDAALQPPLRRGPSRMAHSNPEVLPNDWYKRMGPGGGGGGGGLERTWSVGDDPKGPEPFSLEKIWREPYNSSSEVDFEAVDPNLGQLTRANFTDAGLPGYGGLVDYLTAMGRRRAIAGAELVHLKGNFISKTDVLNLLVVYCSMDHQPDQVELLQRTTQQPVCMRALSAAKQAATVTALAAGPAAAAAAAAADASKPSAARQADLESEAERQRIRAAAWLLGVTWRRITNETYTSFLVQVLGWPPEVAGNMHRTRATHLIARALVRGHDMREVTKPPPR